MRTLLVLVAVMMITTLAQAQDIRLVANGKTVVSDPPPMMHEGRVFVPLRAAAEAVGGEVKYDAASKTIQVCRGGLCSFLRQSDGITVNGRLLLGIRQVAEAVDVKVDWDAPHRTVRLTSKPPGLG